MSRRSPIISLAALCLALLSASCSIPNLEPQECVEARDTVTKFYSFHFGNEMKPTRYEDLSLAAWLVAGVAALGLGAMASAALAIAAAVAEIDEIFGPRDFIGRAGGGRLRHLNGLTLRDPALADMRVLRVLLEVDLLRRVLRGLGESEDLAELLVERCQLFSFQVLEGDVGLSI